MTDTKFHTPEEVAQILKLSRFTVYEMIKRGDIPAYRIGRKVRVEAPDLESYIQRSRNSSAPVQIPSPAAADTPQDSLVICGQDALLDVLARHAEMALPNTRVLRRYIGSIDGLAALYRGTANIVTTHLWDSLTDTYNLPYVRHFLPGHRAVIINAAYRMEGFYVAAGNPKEIQEWKDLARPDVRFVNRERGSGARVLIDEKLRVHNIDPSQINGYSLEETSHLAIASCVARQDADVGVGIEKAARQVSRIEFIPLQKERYDFVIRKADLQLPHIQKLLAIIRSSVFRNELQGIGDYDLSHIGEVMGET